MDVRYLIYLFLQAILMIILAGVILSYVEIGARRASWLYHPAINLIRELSFQILRPFRRLLERFVGRTGPIDFSPMAAWLTIVLIERLLGIR